MHGMSVHRSSGGLGILWGVLLACPAAGQVCYVDVNASGNNDGTSWQNAYTSLKTALSNCQFASEIRVADGVYRADNCDGQPCNRNACFELMAPLHGGYAGASDPNLPPNPSVYVTILSGDMLGDDGECAFPESSCRDDNLYNVVCMSSGDRLSGVIVEGGFNDITGTLAGAGIRVGGHGGNLPDVGDLESRVTIDRCIVRSNYADTGGGIFASISVNLFITNSTISGNRSAGNGGGIALHGNARLNIYNSRILNNMAMGGGGGMIFEMPLPLPFPNGLYGTIVNCLIAGNSAMDDSQNRFGGGGVFVDGGFTDVSIANSTIVQNFAQFRGGGVFAENTVHEQRPVVLANCIVRDNLTADDGRQLGIGDFFGFTPQIMDVFYSNVRQASGDPLEVFGDIEFGAGVIDADPLFSDPDGPDDDPATVEDNDYRLRAGSPCIDSGSTLLVPPDLPDLNGNLDYAERLPLALDGVSRRIFDDVNTPDTGVNDPPDYHPVVDMGAYEVLSLFRPPDPADPPHDCRKNRYISFTPNTALDTVGYLVRTIGIPADVQPCPRLAQALPAAPASHERASRGRAATSP